MEILKDDFMIYNGEYSMKNYIIEKINEIYSAIYERNLKNKLKNENFSIISSNCIGGLIYHRLDHKFLSPTINLWMWQYDYLKFVLDLEKYLSLELAFIESEYSYPVARLEDIKIYFNHYSCEEEANECWNKRKKRINYDNLFLIMYDKDGLDKNDLEKLKSVKCKGKLVISNREFDDLDYVIKIPADMNNPETRYRLDKNKFTSLRTFEKYFDYVKWLNKNI